jgi:hypothetical protein
MIPYRSSISQMGVNFPQIAQQASSHTLEKCQHRSQTQYFDITLQMVEMVETSHLFWTKSISFFDFLWDF